MDRLKAAEIANLRQCKKWAHIGLYLGRIGLSKYEERRAECKGHGRVIHLWVM